MWGAFCRGDARLPCGERCREPHRRCQLPDRAPHSSSVAVSFRVDARVTVSSLRRRFPPKRLAARVSGFLAPSVTAAPPGLRRSFCLRTRSRLALPYPRFCVQYPPKIGPIPTGAGNHPRICRRMSGVRRRTSRVPRSPGATAPPPLIPEGTLCFP